MEKFTKELCDLFVKQNITLSESLYIMSHKPKGKTKKAAEYIYSSICQGIPFSNSLKTCPFIKFDNVFITFVLLSELSGNLKEAIQYLNKRCIRSKENKNKMISAFIYPAFVIVLSLCACFYLCVFLDIDKKGEVIKSFIFLIIFCLGIFYILFKILGNNKLYEAFLGTNLLIKNGISVSSATYCGALIAGIESKEGKIFLDAGERLGYGMDLQSAFNLNSFCKEAFYYADVAGGDNDVFEKVSDWIGEKELQKRSICMQLIEPVFIALTGSFIFLIIMKFFIPILGNFNFF